MFTGLQAIEVKRLKWFLAIGMLLTAIVLAVCIAHGIRRNDMMLRFREREAVTFVSGTLLCLTAQAALLNGIIKKRAGISMPSEKFWFLSAAGFLFLCLDEFLMIHEGIDNGLGRLLGTEIKHLNLDNLVILAYGLLAVGVCYYFRREILGYKVMLLCLALGALFLGGTIAFHCLERIDMRYEVAEESFKLLGVVCFFIAYFLALLSSLDRLKISGANT